MDAESTHSLEGLALLDIGVAVFDRSLRLAYCNPAFRGLRRYPENICRKGVTLEALLRFNAERGDFGPGDVDAQVGDRLREIEQAQEREIEREMADGQILRIRYRRTASGGLLVTFEDRTEERRAQAALAASEERYALVAEAAEDAIYEWDIVSGRFYASPPLKALIGREWGDGGTRAWAWEEIIHPDDRAHYRDCLERHLSGADERWECEYRITDASGALRWVSDHGTSIRGRDGRAVRMVAAVRDITERVEKDAALAASEERHILVTRATSDGIYDWNVTDDVLFVSENLTRLLDFDLGNKASSMWAERVHPDDYPGYRAAIRAHFKGEAEAVDCEYRVRAKGGGYRWVHDRGVGVRNEQGRVTRLVGAVRDITDIKEAKAELDRTEARLAASLATISDGILLVDPENRVQLWNERYYEIFSEAAGRADLSELIVKGRPFFEMIRDGYRVGMFKPHPEGVGAWVEARKKAWDQPVSQWELELANGTWILLNERRMPDGGRVSVYTDITDLKAREAEAQAAHQRFEEAVGAISSGFVLWDAEDRLVTCNAPFREIYSGLENLTRPGVSHRELVDAAIAQGMFPNSARDPNRYLKPSLETRARGEGIVREQYIGEGRWLQITDHRTEDGGLVSIYTDVTELKSREQDAQAARQRFEEAIEAISSGFTLWDADDRLVVCNSRYRHYFSGFADMVVPGVSFRELIFTAIKRGMFPGVTEAEAFLARTLEKRSRTRGEPREQHLSDGTWLQITDHRTADGGIVSIYTDVTELKTRQAEAQAARQRFEEAIEAISSGFSLWDAEDRLVVCNSRYCELYQDLADVVRPGIRFRDVVSQAIERGLIPAARDDPEGYLEEHLRRRAGGLGKLREHRLSSGLWLQITDHRTADGGIVSIHTDVTELKNSEEALRQKSAILEQTLENMGQGITLVDRNLRTLAFNKKFFELLEFPEDRFGHGFTMEEAFRFNAERGEYGPGDVEEQVRQRVELAAKFLPHRFERTRPDGTVIEVVGNPMEDGGFVSTYTDITERKKIEEALKSTLAELNAVLDNINYGVILLDRNLRARVVNRVMKRLWDFSDEFIAKHPTMREMIEINRHTGRYAVSPEDWDIWVAERIEQVRRGDIAPTDMYRGNGSVLQYQCVALPDGGRMLTYFDITELKAREAEITRARDAAEAALADLQRAQERLIQAEKMASLGQLTAGIAHEIKNPLNFVNNFARLSDEMVGELAAILEAPIAALDGEAREDAEDLLGTVRDNLTKIAEHGRRADSIVKNMLLHAREGPSERQSVGLNAIAEEALNLAYHGARAEHPGFNIEMVRELDPEVGEIECYPQDLMRVFLNLISNGMYAADRRGADAGAGFSPTISLTTRAHDDRVEIEVRDNGTGIPPELRDRIFIPFFTTKPAGEGTGLGLSLSYDIVVKQHGGDIEVESEPGAFTMFRVTLPRQLPESGGNSK